MNVILHDSVRVGHGPIDVSRTDWSRTGMEAAECSSRCHLCDKDQCASEFRFAMGPRFSSDRLSHVGRDCLDHGEGRE